MTPATVRAALETLVTETTGIPSGSIYWKHRPIGYTGPQYAICYLSGFVSRGRDLVEYDYDDSRPTGEELEPRQKGLRSVVWQVQLFSHEATDTDDALSLASALRDRIHLDEHRDALAAAELGVDEVLLLVELPTNQDQRDLSAAQLDVRLNSTADTAGTRIGYVEQWGITGTATLADGSETIVDGDLP